MEILREDPGIIISQRKYTFDLHQYFDISHLDHVSSPMDPSCKLSELSGMPISNPSIYRHLIGKLKNLTHTKLDLSYAVLTLSQYMKNPCDIHFTITLRVLDNLKGHSCRAILLSASPPLSFNFFCVID